MTIMFSSLEHCDNFYVNLLSNVPSLAQNNHPAHFKVALPERIRLQGAWKVGLAEIFIPSYGFNIKPPPSRLRWSFTQRVLVILEVRDGGDIYGSVFPRVDISRKIT